jgi:hypothetical protein
MRTSRIRFVTIAASVLVTASVAVTGMSVAASGSTGSTVTRATSSVANPPVLVNCAGHARVQPASYVLTCADANTYLAHLRWSTWHYVAFATGVERVNTCRPSCAAGHFRTYPVLVNLWRARHKHGIRYFSRLTTVFTGKRPRINGQGLITQTWVLGSRH